MPTPYRYTTPLPHKSATGRSAEVFAQIAEDFGIEGAATFTVLSSAPELLAPTWALTRESLIAGEAPRTGKEIAALGVSLANQCQFCVAAHTVLLHATGDHRLGEAIARGEVPKDPGQARLLAWAKATSSPAPDARLPFPRAEAPAFVGTVLAFHFINRIASALLTEKVLPGNAQKLRCVRSLAGRSVSKAVRRTPPPGLSLKLLDAPGPGPDWAAGTPVGPAYAALRTAASTGEGLLPKEDAAFVREAVAVWDGSHPPLHWPELPSRADRPGARLALLAALAPYRVTDEDVAAWLVPPHTDHCLVHLIAFGAFLAVDRVEQSLAAQLARALTFTVKEAS
ncbi:carboxymuconolactone decarboxylase family protein [Streptomyces sp. NBC_01304]|uniref:carboxymuconolactone decarboxylase family protein n=1 Tax=Streptomyces sp. NBC_01304 TaxID=2903818 RepID=UPI002E115DDA|nr:carboxymuconolactone decarboxylase family protein [Streptomyces sp. NBC_01304]